MSAAQFTDASTVFVASGLMTYDGDGGEVAAALPPKQEIDNIPTLQ